MSGLTDTLTNLPIADDDDFNLAPDGSSWSGVVFSLKLVGRRFGLVTA